MLSHGNIMHNVTTVNANIGPAPGMIWLSVLPVWHSFERTVEYCSLYFGSTIAYSQPSEWKILEDLKSLHPNYLVINPVLLESIQKSLEKKMSYVEKRLIRFEKFYLVFSGFVTGKFPRFTKEERILEIFAAFLPLIILSPIKLFASYFLRRKVKSLTGNNLGAIICGGGPMPAYLDRFFAAIGIDILEGYGLTEASPIVSVRVEKAPVLGTAGRPLPYTEIRILGENGEELPPGRKGSLLIKGPQVMQGYYNDVPATQEAVSSEGWLDTGDAGMLTLDGNLIVTGRVKHAIILRSGEKVEPEPIEMVLQESPFISEAVVVGDRRESVGILIVPNMNELKAYARTKQIEYSDDQDLSRNPIIFRLFQEETQSRLVNNGIGFPGGRAAKLAILPSGFEVGRELTRTLSKKREVIAEMYQGVIDRLYRS